jgi:NAD(P)-dependent dehydrogenase (short-subunit alcohol dehydrogenase family)
MILSGKTIVVGGVGRGMSRKLSRQAAAVGARMVLAGCEQDVIEEVAAEIAAAGNVALPVLADLARPEDCTQVVKTAIAAFGQIDGIVNSAYRASFVPFAEADLADWRTVFDVTLFAPLNLTKAALPAFEAVGQGVVVNISSMVTRRALKGQGAYAAAKAALQATTRQLALELGPKNIRVNNVVMGHMWGYPVQSYFSSLAAETGISVEELKARTAANIPLGHVPTDEACADAIIMLLSDYAGEVTGATLDINGGEYMPQ